MFRAGAAVICVDARRSDGALQVGGVYTLAAVSDRFLYLDGFPGRFAGWHRFRFRPAPSITMFKGILQSQQQEVIYGA